MARYPDENMRFRKYHGTGNDFVMLTDLDGRLGGAGSVPSELVAALCDRHTGVGADGLIRVVAAAGDREAADAGASYRMDYYNADGGAAEMCGNGIRCLVVHEHRAGRLTPGEHLVLTGAGPVSVELLGPGRVMVGMGEPSVALEGKPTEGVSLQTTIEVDGEQVTGATVSMGNPHFVVFVDEDPTDELVGRLGPRIEHHGAFPNRTNVEFVRVMSATRIRMRVWERGVGETLACGSGACAAVAAASLLQKTGPHLFVQVPGGELEVEWSEGSGIWLTGPAEEVFSGDIDADWLTARGLERFIPLAEGVA